MANRAREIVEKRGGPQSVKEDAEELQEIAKGQGTMSDKLKRAAQAIKDPAARRGASAQTGPATAGVSEPPNQATAQPITEQVPSSLT